jgi:hypothetical protein
MAKSRRLTKMDEWSAQGGAAIGGLGGAVYGFIVGGVGGIILFGTSGVVMGALTALTVLEAFQKYPSKAIAGLLLTVVAILSYLLWGVGKP